MRAVIRARLEAVQNQPRQRSRVRRSVSKPVLQRQSEAKEKRSKKLLEMLSGDDISKEQRDALLKGQTVYFIRCGDFVKIGYTTKDVRKRYANLSTGSPYEYQFLGSIPGTKKVERLLHSVFSSFRHKGEWFRLGGMLNTFVAKLTESRHIAHNDSCVGWLDSIHSTFGQASLLRA